MALFRRNNSKAVVLPKLEKYYDEERRERSGLAWILALVSIAAVALLLIGLFFGGRFLYRTLTTDRNPGTTVVVNKDSDNTNEFSGTPLPGSDAKNETINKPTVKPVPTTTGPVNPPVNTPPAQSSTTPTTQVVAPSNLADTGPADTAAYFIVATVIGTVFYRIKLRRSTR